MKHRTTRYLLYGAAAFAAALAPVVSAAQDERPARPAAPTPIRRTADGHPDIAGYYDTTAGGANQGLGPRPEAGARGKGVLVDPPGGKVPYQPWSQAEQENRALPERGYDDSTAHCFMGGLPRAMWTSSFEILQPPNYVVFLWERMNYRSIPLDGRPHIDDAVRLWQGDGLGHWEGDVLVVETRNFNGKAWLTEAGDFVSYAEQLVERFTPVDGDTIKYEATITDPVVFARPFTVAFLLKRLPQELLEVACLEDDRDLPHLKAIKDAAKAGAKK